MVLDSGLNFKIKKCKCLKTIDQDCLIILMIKHHFSKQTKRIFFISFINSNFNSEFFLNLAFAKMVSSK